MGIERILIPLDGSETAEAALAAVRPLVRRHQAETLVFRAVLAPTDFHLAVPTLLKEARGYVNQMVGRLAEEGLKARGIVRQGGAATSILETAVREGASLIAMSSHGRTGLARWTFGSVAEKVLRASTVPVLVTRSFGPRIRENAPFRTILVPLDGSEASLSVIPTVLEVARPVDAHVVLLNVQEPTEFDGRWETPEDPVVRAAETLRTACIPSVGEVRRGDPAVEILRAAGQFDADLIAMSTHGRSGPSRWILGSVTEKILRASSIPMLVTRRELSLASSRGGRGAEASGESPAAGGIFKAS